MRRVAGSCRAWLGPPGTGQRAIAATAGGAADRERAFLGASQPDQLIGGGPDDVHPQPGPPGHLGQRPGAVLQGVQDGGHRSGYHHRLPTWKTSTASPHATANWIAMPNRVQRPPISRHWAARVATQGVYAIRKIMKASAAGIG